MKNLFIKELNLARHPAALLFTGLAAMMLIPNYPLTVTFFYPCLGAFFICQNGRENRDIFYTALLPIEKRDVVRARVLHVCLLQACLALLCLPFCLLRGLYPPAGNAVGLNANLALVGFGLAEMGLFNRIFFPRYYKDPNKIGGPFLLGCAGILLWATLSEALPHFVSFFRDRLDTALFLFLPEKLACFFCGAAVFALLTLRASRLSERRFETLDL